MNNGQYAKVVKPIGFILLGLCLLYFLVQTFHSKPKPGLAAPRVMVQKPESLKMTRYIIQTGNTVAYNSVDLVARVEGYLRAIEFTDGSFVKKGQELFVIQPEPYAEQLKAAVASVAVAKASYAYTLSEYARQQRMYKQNATSLNDVEKWQARSQETEAEVDKAVANEQLAAITYSYTHVLSPFDGQIGRHLVSTGNLVGNGVATTLATVQQIDKLYVYFNLNELDFIALREAARAEGMTQSDVQQLMVDIALQDQKNFKYQATLDFVNTGLNASTGAMELRALLDNKNHTFVPGLFVQVRVPITKPTAMLAIPDEAILFDQIGPYVYTVDKQNIAQLKRVSLGPLNSSMRGILSGLDANDLVIVQGLQNASPGSPVDPKLISGTKLS